MKKLYLLLLLPFIIGAAPARLSTYTTGTTIEASAVTGNEDAIFNYLQNGVEVYKNGTLLDEDVNSAAAIAASKLDLTPVTQNISHSGTLTQTGTMTAADLTATTADINAGTVDATVGGTTPAAGSFTTVSYSTSISDGTTAVTEWSLDGTMAGDSDTAIPTEKSVKTYVESSTAPYAAGTTEYLISYGDTEDVTSTSSYVKYKEIVLTRDGQLRIDFDIKVASGGTYYGRVYRNGVAVGTEQSGGDTTYATKTEDISGWSAGDLCQLYVKEATGAKNVTYRNFRIYATIPTVEVVNLDT